MPLVWLSTLRIVMGCAGFRSRAWLSSCSTVTSRPLNSGRYFSTGSSRPTFPWSTSIMNAAALIDFDCEAIQNIASGRMGVFAATSIYPTASWLSTCSFEATSVTAPASAWRSTNGWRTAAGPFPESGAGSCDHAGSERSSRAAREVFIVQAL